jgi:hypothetical protein
MKVSGFTFIRNALKYDYPIVEAILSILPICDEFIVAVGNSDDDTLALIQNIDSQKIKIIQTVWDDSLRANGEVLAIETNKAFKAISSDSDWAFYIQGDEIVHEKYLNSIQLTLQKYTLDNEVDGLLFNYKHFYGSYDFIGSSNSWYKKEIRIIRNTKQIYSYKDAQGFRKEDNKKLKVVAANASIYHYGWVKDPRSMQFKQEDFNKLWHNDEWISKNIEKVESFEYEKHISQLRLFDGDHPLVMKDRIERLNWKFEYDISKNSRSFKDFLKDNLLLIGLNFNYKNYIFLRRK